MIELSVPDLQLLQGKKLPEDIVNKIGENVRPDWNDLPESKPKPQCSVM